jgi:hypothetical protein
LECEFEALREVSTPSSIRPLSAVDRFELTVPDASLAASLSLVSTMVA